MKATVLDEPLLEFGNGHRHVDPRTGIATFGPADAGDNSVGTVRLGVVGTQEAIDSVRRWLDRCRDEVAAKESHLARFFVPFPGYNSEAGFFSKLEVTSRLERRLDKKALANIATLGPVQAIREAVDLYDTELRILDEEPNCHVVLVCRPDDLRERNDLVASADRPWLKPRSEPVGFDFRDLLKARSLTMKRPIQLIRRETWDPTFKPQQREPRRQQDEATRAWNLFTALYYKAGGLPWRMIRESSDLDTCYVGVAFFRSSDRETVQTSVAQIFNERGDGVIVRGAAAISSSDDRQPHLARADAHDLLERALRRYRSEHRNAPARIMLHKTSSFTADEIEGFEAAASDERIDLLELVWLPRDDAARLFRQGEQPPLRGTMLSLDQSRHVLYTKGAVPFYQMYPGMYVPHALPFRPVVTESSPEQIASELLTLSKMNWNATQLDGRLPITIRTAESIGSILKHLPEGVEPEPRYAYYM